MRLLGRLYRGAQSPFLSASTTRGFLLCLLLLWMAASPLYAQNQLREKWIYPSQQQQIIKLDSLSIWPGDFKLELWSSGNPALLDTSSYELDAAYSELVLNSDFQFDSLRCSYRVLGIYLPKRYAHKSRAQLDSMALLLEPLAYQSSSSSDDFWDLGGVDYNGSFSRGLSFGNNQDVVLNSSLNLQLGGLLPGGVEIEAAITDNNIPIQPEGNTQQLQEFDRVYIRLRKNRQQLQVGDFELLRNESYFLNIYKRLQGAQYEGGFELGNGADLETRASIAVARGEYRRMFIPPEEGNQGPYRLNGNSGERFVIVIAGSERVFIDGRVLTRGADNDYVIDYNAGEITFSPNILITKDLRIWVEFEYSERNYFRSMAQMGLGWTSASKKWKIELNTYSEQDARNQAVDQELGAEERNILEGAGNSFENASVPGWDSIGFETDRVLYRLTDSLGFDTVFVYSTDEDQASWNVSFALVGDGNGDYILSSESTANGRVYEWIAPVGGLPQGNYAPVRILVAPELKQMMSIRSSLALGAGEIYGEFALARRDPNTFSGIDNAENGGWATQIGFKQSFALDSLKSWFLDFNGIYEYTSARFQPIERYRPVEFVRDWNLGTQSDTATEHITQFEVALRQGADKQISYGYSNYIRPDSSSNSFIGNRHFGSFRYFTEKLRMSGQGSMTSTQTDSNSSYFLRPKADVSYRLGNKAWWIGARGEIEDIRYPIADTDSLGPGTFYYDQWTAYIKSPDSSRSNYSIEYTQRRDLRARSEGLGLSSHSGDLKLLGSVLSKKGHRVKWTGTWRELSVFDSAQAGIEPGSALLGRMEYAFSAGSGLLRGDVLYELGTSREPRREFAYLEVEPGQGQYTWNDYNDNGVAELDEFEIAAFNDQATYIRVFTPTEEFISANNVGFRYSLSLDPRAIWHDAKGIRNFLGRFSAQSSWQLSRRIQDENGAPTWNPIQSDELDSTLLGLTDSWRHSVWFDRSKPKFGLEYAFRNDRNVNLIASGIEDRLLQEHRIKSRWALGKVWQSRMELALGEDGLESQAFEGRDYRQRFYEIEPELSYQSGTDYRISLSYLFRSSDNRLSTEQLRSHELEWEARYSRVGKSSVELNFSTVMVDYSGAEVDSPVGFAMLEGLQDGLNLIWQLNYDRRLSKFVQLNLGYEGRKTGSSNTQHIGRASLRALF